MSHSETWQQQEHVVARTNTDAALAKMQQQLTYMNVDDLSLISQLNFLQGTLSNIVYWASRMQALG